MSVSVRPTVYRDRKGFAVVGSPPGQKGFPISIFVRCRSTAVRIRKLYNALPREFENHDAYRSARDKVSTSVDMLIHADSRVKFCRR